MKVIIILNLYSVSAILLTKFDTHRSLLTIVDLCWLLASMKFAIILNLPQRLFSRKFEKWSCKWCKSVIKHKFRLNLILFLENFLLKHNIRWQEWQTNFKIYQNLCIRVDFCTTFLSICGINSIFGIKSASLRKISLFAVNDLLVYLYELHIFPSPTHRLLCLTSVDLRLSWRSSSFLACISDYFDQIW